MFFRKKKKNNEPESEDKSAEKEAEAPKAAEPEPQIEAPEGGYKKVVIKAGKRGWGGPLEVEPTEKKPYIYCVTGGGIHPVAQKIADMTGGVAFDGFNSKRDFDEMACVVIDCGGTARVGVYPMKGVLTIDVHATKPSGPLMRFIKEDNFVSGVGVDQIEATE